MRVVRTVVAGVAVGALTMTLAACGGSSSRNNASDGGGSATALTIYSGQHPDLVDSLGKAFTAKTDIKINIRSGEDTDLISQIQEEGSKTRADIYLSEEPGAIGVLAKKGLLVKVPQADLSKVDQRLVPSTRDWVPYAARTRVILYDPKLISKSDLPHSILDLTQPKWKGTFAYAPSGAFTGTVSYLIHSIGQDKTLAWLKGIKTNGINEQSNGKVRDTVEAGQHEFGLANHYYWWRLAQAKGGPGKLTSKIYYFAHPDAGGLVMASGAGVLKTSKHQTEALEFLSWLVSPDGGQKIVGGPDAEKDGAQFPVDPGVNSQIPGVPPLSSLKTPDVNQSVFSDSAEAINLIEQAGIA